MICPLCGVRKARRVCPGVGHQICALCCGTKRLTEIRCPPDCAYLHTAREHPPAVVVRRQQQDVALLLQCVSDFNERQTGLFVALGTAIRRYQPPELQPLIDDDVAESANALAATYETASRGVIYEHAPASGSAARLTQALKPLLAEAAGRLGRGFDRDAAVVLRRIEEAARQGKSREAENRRAFLDLLTRVLGVVPAGESTVADREPSRLIVP